MIDIKHIIAAGLVGLLGYLFVVSFVIDKPLTNTIHAEYLDVKTKHLQADAGKPRIVILAGSNGRFSHRCELIEREFGMPCTNMSVAFDLSLTWQLQRLLPLLAKGDLLYLPLELGISPAVGAEAPYLVRYDWRGLANYSLLDMTKALFSYGLRDIISAVGEMVLVRAGVQRRFSLNTMTANGDESGNTREKGSQYRAYLDGYEPFTVFPDMFGPDYWQRLEPVKDALKKGVIVVGGLPTLFDRARVPDESVAALRKGYLQMGACFLEMPNKSQFPVSDFYDTIYHLNEETQIKYSRALGTELVRILREGHCQKS